MLKYIINVIQPSICQWIRYYRWEFPPLYPPWYVVAAGYTTYVVTLYYPGNACELPVPAWGSIVGFESVTPALLRVRIQIKTFT